MTNPTRELLRPKEPRTLDFEIAKDFLPKGFVHGYIIHKDKRHIMLASDRQLQHRSRSGQWFMDGTFKIVKRPFHQLLTIHAYVCAGSNFKLMPLVFVIMSRRRTSDYVKVLKKLLELLPIEPQVKTIILYFEQAAWKAISKTLPEARICGCLFHLTQAVWRKCQEIGLQDDAIHKFVRKIMALPLLPAADITRIFLRIAERVKATGKMRDLINYFQAQWIAHLTFSPRSWSVFNIAVRTNNFVEGWHRHINNKVSEQSLGIYRLIPELFREASLLPLQPRLIQEGRLRAYVRKSSTSRQEEIFDIWRRYKDGDLSLTQVLSQCLVVHGPIL